MTAYTVKGRFRGRDGWLPFERIAEAVNEAVAEEHTLAELGSEHGLKRTQIEVEEVRA